jgi:hypothetical protein
MLVLRKEVKIDKEKEIQKRIIELWNSPLEIWDPQE